MDLELDDVSDVWIAAGVACRGLISDPKSWINRRVETVEMLGREEIRRRVSVDFSLPDKSESTLKVPDGLVVPISALTKEARRHFDLRDEGGKSIPVLGRGQNGLLSHVAVLGAALEALDALASADAFELLAAELGGIVYGEPEEAYRALSVFASLAEEGGLRQTVWQDPQCRSLLTLLVDNYILFAVLAPDGANRRVLKYSYSEDFPAPQRRPLRAVLRELPGDISRPDRRLFSIEAPGAYRARSFHMEIVIPEELRFDVAVLRDRASGEWLGEPIFNVDRAALYAPVQLEPDHDLEAVALVAPERSGLKLRAAVTAAAVAGLLWLGVCSGLDAENPGPAVSLLLAGAALYSGLVADQGEPRIVRRVFGATRRWLAAVTLAALTGSATLAMEVPSSHPVGVWTIAAGVASVAALRLGWSAIRARH